MRLSWPTCSRRAALSTARTPACDRPRNRNASRARAVDGCRRDLGLAAGQDRIDRGLDQKPAAPSCLPAAQKRCRRYGVSVCGGRIGKSVRGKPPFAAPAGNPGTPRYAAGRRRSIIARHALPPGNHSVVRCSGGHGLGQRTAVPGLLQSHECTGQPQPDDEQGAFRPGGPAVGLAGQGAVGLEPEHLELRIATLDEIGHQLYDRARWIRRTLMSLLISVLCMLACSLCLGLATLTEAIAVIAPWLFVAGTISMMVGILAAIEELRGSLQPLLFEHEQIDDLP